MALLACLIQQFSLALHVCLDAQVSDGIGFQQVRQLTFGTDDFLIQRGCDRIEPVGVVITLLSNLCAFLLCGSG